MLTWHLSSAGTISRCVGLKLSLEYWYVAHAHVHLCTSVVSLTYPANGNSDADGRHQGEEDDEDLVHCLSFNEVSIAQLLLVLLSKEL